VVSILYVMVASLKAILDWTGNQCSSCRIVDSSGRFSGPFLLITYLLTIQQTALTVCTCVCVY